MVQKIVFSMIIVFSFLLAANRNFAEESFEGYCRRTFIQESLCPHTVCRLVYPEKEEGERELDCQPKECIEIDPAHCPLNGCQLLTGCNEKEVCFYRQVSEPSVCGELAYSGKLSCCEGLVKRCGVEFFDGSCDLIARHTVYGVPICIPCGNGICNQFENKCNCPEDC